MSLIELRRRGEHIGWTTVDPDDFDRFGDTHWCLAPNGYVFKHLNGKPRRYLHREIMGLTLGDGLEVDHRNGNPLDNRRSNLRIVSRAGNAQNVHSIRPRSGYRGVCLHNGRWQATQQLSGKTHYLGRFDTPEEANATVVAFRAQHMPYSQEAAAA
jgi:hypothetical protein